MDGILRWMALERVRGIFRTSNGRLFGGKPDTPDLQLPTPQTETDSRTVDSSKE